MRTFGRILIILTAFAVVMGTTYFTVSAGSSSSSTMPQFASGERPVPPVGRFERSEQEGSGGSAWIFGLMKNMVIVAVIVALIVVPKNLLKERRRAIPVITK